MKHNAKVENGRTAYVRLPSELIVKIERIARETAVKLEKNVTASDLMRQVLVEKFGDQDQVIEDEKARSGKAGSIGK